jgi:hypothetical protein
MTPTATISIETFDALREKAKALDTKAIIMFLNWGHLKVMAPEDAMIELNEQNRRLLAENRRLKERTLIQRIFNL